MSIYMVYANITMYNTHTHTHTLPMINYLSNQSRPNSQESNTHTHSLYGCSSLRPFVAQSLPYITLARSEYMHIYIYIYI